MDTYLVSGLAYFYCELLCQVRLRHATPTPWKKRRDFVDGTRVVVTGDPGDVIMGTYIMGDFCRGYVN